MSTVSTSDPTAIPLYSNLTTDQDGNYNTGAEGNIHINNTSDAPEVWIWA